MLAAPQPLLLLIDDLQWCDQETLEWLQFLLRVDPQQRLLIIGTARGKSWSRSPGRPMALGLGGEGRVTELHAGGIAGGRDGSAGGAGGETQS